MDDLPIIVKDYNGDFFEVSSGFYSVTHSNERLDFRLNEMAARRFLHTLSDQELSKLNRYLASGSINALAFSTGGLAVKNSDQLVRALCDCRISVCRIGQGSSDSGDDLGSKREKAHKLLIPLRYTSINRKISAKAGDFLIWNSPVEDVVLCYKALCHSRQGAWPHSLNPYDYAPSMSSKILLDSRYKKLLWALGINPLRVKADSLVKSHKATHLLWQDLSTRKVVLKYVQNTAIGKGHLSWRVIGEEIVVMAIFTAVLATFAMAEKAINHQQAHGQLFKPLVPFGRALYAVSEHLTISQKDHIPTKVKQIFKTPSYDNLSVDDAGPVSADPQLQTAVDQSTPSTNTVSTEATVEPNTAVQVKAFQDAAYLGKAFCAVCEQKKQAGAA